MMKMMRPENNEVFKYLNKLCFYKCISELYKKEPLKLQKQFIPQCHKI